MLATFFVGIQDASEQAIADNAALALTHPVTAVTAVEVVSPRLRPCYHAARQLSGNTVASKVPLGFVGNYYATSAFSRTMYGAISVGQNQAWVCNILATNASFVGADCTSSRDWRPD